MCSGGSENRESTAHTAQHSSAQQVPDVRISSWGDRHQPLPVSRPDPWRWALHRPCPLPCQESGRNGWGFVSSCLSWGGGAVMCTSVLMQTWPALDYPSYLPPVPSLASLHCIILGYHVDIMARDGDASARQSQWSPCKGVACMIWVLPGPARPSLPPFFLPSLGCRASITRLPGRACMV